MTIWFKSYLEDHQDVFIGWATGIQQLTCQFAICSFELFQFKADIDILEQLQQKPPRQLEAGTLALQGNAGRAGLAQTGKDTALGGNCKAV